MSSTSEVTAVWAAVAAAATTVIFTSFERSMIRFLIEVADAAGDSPRGRGWVDGLGAQLDADEGFGEDGHAVGFHATDEAGLVGFGIQLDEALDLHVERVGDPVVAEVAQGADVLAGGEGARGVLRTS